MPQRDEESDEMKNKDIIFECEHCGKSLAIDYRGAGLKVQCPDCNMEILVPIPNGIDLSDIDLSLGELHARGSKEPETALAGEETAVVDSTEDVKTLMTELEELRFRTNYLEKERSKHTESLETMSKQLSAIRTALNELDDIFNSLTEKSSDDTQELG